MNKILLYLKLTIEIIRSPLLEDELQLIKEFKLALVPYLEAAFNKNQIARKWDPQQIASILVGMYFYTILTSLTDTKANPMLAQFYTYLDMLWQGIEGEVN
ncbi:MAG: hypothetical protein GX334_02015 [Firmicutes bacterium]|nr:hypothetical protein [Bacillota bacterium]